MAIGWMSVLKMVPWGDVISNAPKVADSARKLWNTVAGGKSSSPVQEPSMADASAFAAMPQSQAMVALQAQLTATEATVAELHRQMLASSEVIAALAEQNTQLIQRVETHRRRVMWLSWLGAALAVVTLINLALTWTR